MKKSGKGSCACKAVQAVCLFQTSLPSIAPKTAIIVPDSIGYNAVMITDTAFYRNPNYHSAGDTIDTLDFVRMSRLLEGLIRVAKDLTRFNPRLK